MKATSTELAALRSIAALEALKGLLAVGAGIATLSLRHKDLADVAEHALVWLHMDPDSNFGQSFIRFAEHNSGHNIGLLAFLAFIYATGRFVEGFGLWRARAWAEWFALLTGCMYLPWEIYELVRHATLIRWGVLGINICIVLYMAALRWRHGQMHDRQVVRKQQLADNRA